MTLTAEDIAVARGGRTLLDGVSLRLEPGRLTAILGPNGAGKSTLLKAMAGDVRPTRGRVRLDGRDIAGLSPAALAARLAVLPQEVEAAFPFPAREVVGWGARSLHPEAADRVVADALDAVEAHALADRPVTRLSGGERRRVHLARALAQAWAIQRSGRAPVLLLDEPTTALDPRHQHLVLRIAADLAAGGAAVAAVLHDLDLAARYADTLVVMHAARIVDRGPPGAVLTADLLRRVYGVEAACVPCRETQTVAVRLLGTVGQTGARERTASPGASMVRAAE